MLYRNEDAYYAFADTVEMIEDEMTNVDGLTEWLKKNGAKFAELDEKFSVFCDNDKDFEKEYYEYCDAFEKELFDFVDASEFICHTYRFDKYASDIIDDYLKCMCEGHPEWMTLIKNVY